MGAVAFIPDAPPIVQTAGMGGAVTLPADNYRHEWAQKEWWFMCGQIESETQEYYFTSSIYPNGTSYLNLINSSGRAHLNVAHGTFTSNPNSRAVGTEYTILHYSSDGIAFNYTYDDGNISMQASAVGDGEPIIFDNDGIVDFPAMGPIWTYSITGVPITGTLKTGGLTLEFSGTMELERLWGNYDYDPMESWKWFMIYDSEYGTAELTLYTINGETGLLTGTSTGDGAHMDMAQLDNGYWEINAFNETYTLEPVSSDTWVSDTLWDGAFYVYKKGFRDKNSFAVVELFYPAGVQLKGEGIQSL